MRSALSRLALVIALILPLSRLIAGEPEKAKDILDPALKDAEASHRNVLLIFHASWCSWCRKLDAVLETPEVKKVIGEDYVVVHLDVQERGDKVRMLENPGAQDVMDGLGGAKSGLPFYAFLDGKGKKIADSMIEGPSGENVGYPGSDEEIALFGRLLKETSRRMTEEQRTLVLKHFHKEGT